MQRKVGRPQKGGAEVGKQGLIQKAREELRLRRFDIFQRKELAIGCVVTPALITYYFKDVDEVFRLIVSSVIEEHYNNLLLITRSNINLDAKYSTAVEFLIGIFKIDINLFETYEHAFAMNMCGGMDYISLFQNELKRLLHECFEVGMPNSFERDVFHGAVWGMCKAAAKYKVEKGNLEVFEGGKTSNSAGDCLS